MSWKGIRLEYHDTVKAVKKRYKRARKKGGPKSRPWCQFRCITGAAEAPAFAAESAAKGHAVVDFFA